jgi:hypothetical protein
VTSFPSGDNATVLPSIELLVLFDTSCRVAADSSADDRFAKVPDLIVGSVISSCVDSCLAVDLQSEPDSGLRVTVK